MTRTETLACPTCGRWLLVPLLVETVRCCHCGARTHPEYMKPLAAALPPTDSPEGQ